MILRFAVAAAALAIAMPATAAHYIVDTGVGSNFRDAPYLYGFGGNSFQWVAVQFFVPTATTITSIEGALAPRVADTTLTVKLYTVGTGTDAPDVSFFSQATSVHDGIGFHGATGLSIPIASGYYYAAFEVLDGQTFNGYDVAGAPNPQAKEAYINCCSNGYHRITNTPVNAVGSLGLGLRIGDSVAGSVPEPAAWTLMIAGFGLVGTALRRRETSVAADGA